MKNSAKSKKLRTRVRPRGSIYTYGCFIGNSTTVKLLYIIIIWNKFHLFFYLIKFYPIFYFNLPYQCLFMIYYYDVMTHETSWFLKTTRLQQGSLLKKNVPQSIWLIFAPIITFNPSGLLGFTSNFPSVI